MRALGKIVLVLVGMVFLTLGFLAFFCVGQLDGLTKVSQATPQEMSLAELLEKGSGHNAHVRLTDFTFGEPVIEQRQGQWKGVWLPLVPALQTKKNGPVVLWVARVSDQEELQEFVKQPTLDVLCVARLPDSSKLRARPTKTFQAAHPKMDLAKATVLAEPAFVLPDGTAIEAEILFDSRAPRTTGLVGFAGLIAGGFCLWRGFRSAPPQSRRGPVKETERPTPPASAEQYAQLAREQELSLHPFSWGLVFGRAGRRGGVLVGCLLGSVVFVCAAVRFVKDGQPGALVFSLVIIGLLLYGGLFLTFMSVGALVQRISGFAVYSSGIRWQQGGATRSALWQDIAEVYRAEVRYLSRGEMRNTVSTMTLKLYDGRVLRMSADTYGNFESLADNVASMHGGWMAAVKRHELAEHGQATFGPVTICDDGLVLNDQFYPWGKFEKYEIQNGSIIFFHLGCMFFSKTCIPLLSIPNSAAMLSLLSGDLTHVIRGRRVMA